MQEQKYSVAVYLRLSRDDEDIAGGIKSESCSISSQRELIRAYVREHDDMEIFDIYADDGYSGANFNRPAFKRMMADIEAENVNCVIVKDLSRFGRDYIEAGRLIQKTFPAFHVRFIALTDHFDSKTADYSTKSLVLPVKNLINDAYCRDISQKVKSHQKIKREQGKFIGAFTAYGYRKSAEDKNKLCPDDYSAGIVKKIFAWKLEGMSMQSIAERLNDLGVLSPMEYKRSLGENYSTGFRSNVTAKWSAVAVKRILTNEVYTGVLVQGKTRQVNYKVKKMTPVPENEWIRVEATHKAIISREDFDMVQRLMKVVTRGHADPREKVHLFTGFLYCGDCKEPMTRRVNRYKNTSKVYYICSKNNKSMGCTRHSILEEELIAVVLRTLQMYVSMFLDVSSQLEYLEKTKVDFEEAVRFDKDIVRLRGVQDKYLGIRAGMHDDLARGVITESDYENFRAIYDKQYQEAKTALENQENMIKRLFRNGVASGVRLERLKETMKLTVLDRDTLLSFINRIEVYEGKRVYVEFRGKEGQQK